MFNWFYEQVTILLVISGGRHRVIGILWSCEESPQSWKEGLSSCLHATGCLYTCGFARILWQPTRPVISHVNIRKGLVLNKLLFLATIMSELT